MRFFSCTTIHQKVFVVGSLLTVVAYEAWSAVGEACYNKQGAVLMSQFWTGLFRAVCGSMF